MRLVESVICFIISVACCAQASPAVGNTFDHDSAAPAAMRIADRGEAGIRDAQESFARLYNDGFNVTALTPIYSASIFPTGAMSKAEFATSVPEPLSIVLLGTVLLGCAIVAKRRTA